ncbi:usherin-like [Lingula anatina]|uniref:Usherin-like n=1 Tax=Lingula anatina TaxID=7574 RepID=A0A1S3HK73_LINAN|nr:usherin-like [Lingula anatina]|eukprot:XP_013386515.1 usherin-like [Lingula anatina]
MAPFQRQVQGVVLLIFLFSRPYLIESQTYRDFPKLFNAAQFKPISTTPSGSTCGIPSRSAYCKSSVYESSLSRCFQDLCEQDCPRRTSLPSYSNLLLASNFGDCVHRDTVNVRPGNSSEDFSSVFNNGPRCYLTPLQTSELGTEDGVRMFTLAVWIWQETGNEGTIYQKVGDNSKTILQVRVSSSNIHIYYSTSSGFYHLKSLDSIPAETWTHLGIQVYGTALSVFLNGLGVGFAASDTYTLAGQIHNGTATEVRVGQAVNGSDQFLGRLQGFRFYPVTLTNREIEEVSSGVLPSVHLQTACRCPPSHPRVKPFRSRFCIKNGVPDNTINQVLRLNNYSHPLEFLNDGDGNSIWVSSFLDDVTITIDLQDEFQVFYVVLQFYSPLPTTVTIERKRAGSPVWERWQLYASDCNAVFSLDNNGPLPSPTSVNCLQFGSSSLPLPLSKGNVTFNLLAPEPVPRPGHNDFYNTPDLYQFVKASQVRVRLQGHFNVTQSRHRYYGLQEYIVTARCQCHGHAEDCDTSTSPYRCNCLLDSHTEGNKCERCQPLYNDKAFTVGDQLNPYNCKPCQCYNHASSCVYNRTLDPYPEEHNRGGGGMCINCQHNTRGQHCDRCIVEFYRPLGKSLFDVDVCSPCGCYAGGVLNGNMDCEKEGGQCYCKDYVGGRQCSECKAGYFNLQPSSDVGCEACNCHTDGTVGGSISCHATTGQCNCKANVRNLKCDACNFGFFNLTSTNPDGCSPCNCDPLGSNDQYCDPTTGQCRCKDNVVGKQCDRCSDGYYDFEGGCKPCGCDVQGTVPNTMCDKVTGQCVCKANVEGRSCDQCKEGFFDFGRDVSVGCSSCDCNLAGTLNSSSLCDKASGNCECKSNVQGRTCNQCRGNTWNLNLTNPDGCESCDCDVTGTQEGNEKPPNELTCDQNSGQCTCLSQRRGRRCEECESGWYINNVPGGGCLNCDCHRQGAITGTVCNSVTGQCQCKAQGSGVTGRRCDTCQDKYYNFDPGRGECEPCRCNPAGSLNDTCHAMTGQCECKEFVTSLKCDQCKPDSSVLEAENPYGCSKTPQQQPPPTYMVLNATSLRIMWGPPDYPNGVILTYFLFRDGQQAAALDPNVTQVLEYNDTGLVPFTDYAYYVQAVNRHGLVQSPEAVFRTPEGPPQGRFDLMVSNVLVNTADMRWTRPTDPNGLVLLFTLTSVTPSNPDVPLVHFNKSEEFETQLTDLIPYTNYTFTITACNLGGCLSATPVWAVTRQAAPTGQGSPNVTAISSTAFYVEWKPPALANGIIIFYELWMQGILQPDGSRNPPLSRIFHPAGQYNPRPTVTPQENALVPPSTNFTVTGLEPYTEYEFLVLSQNDIGKASSPWVVARTLEAVPLSMPPPVISPVSSSQLNITWTSPEERQARGIIVQYRIYERKVTNLTQNPFAPPYYQELVHTAPGTSEFFLHGGLAPYSYHEYMVEACNSHHVAKASQV